MVISSIQIGKNGITENFILTLISQFKKHDIVKIHVLKNARDSGKEGKKDVKKYSDELLKILGNKYTSKVVGFTIIMKKWRKARK